MRLPGKHKRSFFVVVPITGALFAVASTARRVGPMGVVAAGLLGIGWSVLLGVITLRLQRADRGRAIVADTPVFLAIAASSLLLGGGIMYGLLMTAAVAAPPSVLSAMMQPTIPSCAAALVS